MMLHGWGRYPRAEAQCHFPVSLQESRRLLSGAAPLLARGQGRSYGDSSLAVNVLDTCRLDHFTAFDAASGELECEAGVTLAQILDLAIPRGWFLAVVPGTRFVSVGGAIASDVHGKNHHGAGTFSEHLVSMRMLLGNGELVDVSRTSHPELFHATCGGMGLTGIIVSARLKLIPIVSDRIVETVIKAKNLEAVLEGFEAHGNATYSVAWIDCLARGRNLGRSLLMLGEHDNQPGPLQPLGEGGLAVPFDLPAMLLNRYSVGAFNALKYLEGPDVRLERKTAFAPFFFPLDALLHWNRLYGKAGFVQYQFVLPRRAGEKGLAEVLDVIAASGQGSPLAVLKVFGACNQNLLSFPIEGYTLALDFKAEPGVFALLDRLDDLVLRHGGRLYLTKDARMSETMFKRSYPRWQEFEEVRQRYFATGKFRSLQSQRLGVQ